MSFFDSRIRRFQSSLMESLSSFSIFGAAGYGYQVRTCEDSREALSLLEQNPEQIHLVITDLQMPCLDGIELAAELRKINAALPVVLTSAAMVEMTDEKLQSLGIRYFLTKPWERERLLSVLRQVLESSRSE